jgi:TatD DNase family protein
MQISWIDTHTHINHPYPFSTDEYIENAKKANIYKFINIGTTPSEFEKVIETSEKYDGVYFSLGIHPHEANLFNNEILNLIEKHSSHKKNIAIGEIGLDYYYEFSNKNLQINAFQKQCEIALKLKKPIIIHCRNSKENQSNTKTAEEDALEVLSWFSKNYTKETLNSPGVIHCFTGTKEFALKCLDLGFYISFSGIITFKNADDLRDILIHHVPLNRLLIETDSPYLAPVPYRGKPNQSAYMIETAKKIASLKNIELSKLATILNENVKNLFNI